MSETQTNGAATALAGIDKPRPYVDGAASLLEARHVQVGALTLGVVPHPDAPDGIVIDSIKAGSMDMVQTLEMILDEVGWDQLRQIAKRALEVLDASSPSTLRDSRTTRHVVWIRGMEVTYDHDPGEKPNSTAGRLPPDPETFDIIDVRTPGGESLWEWLGQETTASILDQLRWRPRGE